MKTCCGGIIGMGESKEDRIGLLTELATLPVHPESVPVNHLVDVAARRCQGRRAWTGSTSCARSPPRA